MSGSANNRITRVMVKKGKLHYVDPKGKFILSPQEQHQITRVKVSSEVLSPEIDILIRSPNQVLTKAVAA